VKRSIWLGYAIAPFIGPVLYGLVALFIPEITEKKEFGATSWFVSTIFFALISYIACLIFGAPLILILKKLKKLSFLWVVLCGSPLYAISLYITLFYIMGAEITGNKFSVTGYTLLVGLGLGIVVTTVFSGIAGITMRPSGRLTRHLA
jgi:hypothetical protein